MMVNANVGGIVVLVYVGVAVGITAVLVLVAVCVAVKVGVGGTTVFVLVAVFIVVLVAVLTGPPEIVPTKDITLEAGRLKVKLFPDMDTADCCTRSLDASVIHGTAVVEFIPFRLKVVLCAELF